MSNPIGAHRLAIFSRMFGNTIARMREHVADFLIRLNVTPNTLTILGMISSFVAVAFLALGAGDRVGSSEYFGYSWFGSWAGITLIVGCAFDILDGAVAKKSHQKTQTGAFLDSSLDRISDAAVFIGIIIYYLRHPQNPHYAAYIIAAVVALANAEIISYLKARAENFIESCPVGYWQRGERLAGILIGLFCGHIATVMVMLAVLPALTVLRRLRFALQQIHRHEKSLPLLDPKSLKGIMHLALWRYRRGSVPYDLVTAFNIAIILFVDVQTLWP